MSILLDSAAMSSSLGLNDNGDQSKAIFFNPSLLQKQTNLPKQFIWPNAQTSTNHLHEELNEPLVDLEGFFKGDEEATAQAVQLIRTACSRHGFFQVTNHGVDGGLIREAQDALAAFFELPIDEKLRVRRKKGTELSGYSGAHADRFGSELPWKETFSFGYRFESCRNSGGKPAVVDYFRSVLGQDFEHAGQVYQKYAEAMKELSLTIFQLLGISLGVGPSEYSKFFEDGGSLTRYNYYPPCKQASLTFGTGPHSDPPALTILHQDQVGGLQVFSDDKWLTIPPRRDALVINIGDTFMALSNGIYKSCIHRAVVNEKRERRTLAFFVNPREDKVVRAPEGLVDREGGGGGGCGGGGGGGRKYPDFKWFDLLEFTQFHYRADSATFQSFCQWLSSSKPTHDF
ncbi:hypothetical protein Nepgr_009537 [Nepenthes gracilis]|uniref:Fe2OG dioxygenase domain-containing protein n=1 Tax=Nepenthes gracilis TaxID=150966 RepID=A0AAD3SBM1_NEPGR|nr:hypothetical protein Nepgr_009537 [Nepenthes gracilis]